MKLIQKIILYLIICIHQDLICKTINKSSEKKHIKSIPKILQSSLIEINKMLKSHKTKKKDIPYLKRAQQSIIDTQKRF